MMQMRLDLASRVLVEIGLKTVENGASEREGLLVIDHGHKQEDDGGSWWLGWGGDLHEPLLVGVVTPDHLRERVDGLGEDVGRYPRGEEDLGELGHHSTGEGRLLAGGGHLAWVGRRVERPHQLQDVQHVRNLLGVPSEIVCLYDFEAWSDPVYVAAFLKEGLIAWVVSQKIQKES